MALSISKLLLHLQTLIISALFLMKLANSRPDDVTTFTYDSFASDTKGLTYQGAAHVPSGSSFLRLTGTDSNGSPQQRSVGRVLYSTPVQLWEPGRQSTFETTIRFFITSVSTTPADGLAFFIVPVGSTIPPGNTSTGGNLGIFPISATNPSVFAVEFDVYVNPDERDPPYRHIGIDINSPVSSNTTKFENIFDYEVTARINYDTNTKRISVNVNAAGQTFELSYVYNLRTFLPQQVQVGVSASTGPQVAIFDFFSWQFTSTLVYDSSANEDDTYIRQFV